MSEQTGTKPSIVRDWLTHFWQFALLAGGLWGAVNYIETHLADHETRIRAIEVEEIAARTVQRDWQDKTTQILMGIAHDIGELQGRRENQLSKQ